MEVSAAPMNNVVSLLGLFVVKGDKISKLSVGSEKQPSPMLTIPNSPIGTTTEQSCGSKSKIKVS